MQLLLNLKQLRIQIFGDTEKERLHLDVQGESTAADIICPPEVEIKNLDQYRSR